MFCLPQRLPLHRPKLVPLDQRRGVESVVRKRIHKPKGAGIVFQNVGQANKIEGFLRLCCLLAIMAGLAEWPLNPNFPQEGGGTNS